MHHNGISIFVTLLLKMSWFKQLFQWPQVTPRVGLSDEAKLTQWEKNFIALLLYPNIPGEQTGDLYKIKGFFSPQIRALVRLQWMMEKPHSFLRVELRIDETFLWQIHSGSAALSLLPVNHPAPTIPQSICQENIITLHQILRLIWKSHIKGVELVEQSNQ